MSICFPVSEKINQYITTGLSYYDRVISDLKATWKLSVVAVCASLILSLLLLSLIRTCGSCIVFIVIFLYVAGLIGLGVGCMVVANDGIQIEGYEEWTNPEMLRIAAYVCWGVAGISIIALCCSIKKIRVAAAVIKAAAEFTRQECKIIIVPIFMFLAIVIHALFRLLFWCFGLTLQFICSAVVK